MVKTGFRIWTDVFVALLITVIALQTIKALEGRGIQGLFIAADFHWVGSVFFVLSLVSRAYAIDRAHGPVRIVTLAIAAGLASTISLSLQRWFYLAFLSDGSSAPELGWTSYAARSFLDGDALFGYWALLVELPRWVRAHRKAELERRTLARAAELSRLQATFEPHFVLNTLNTIAGLVSDEPRRARRLIAALGDLLRHTLHQGFNTEHTLEEELAWLRTFAAIVETRHAGTVQIGWDIDPAMLPARIPCLILQPVLENALRHGVLKRKEGGHIVIRVQSRSGSVLHLDVVDDGPGFDASTTAWGHGLHLVKRRLELFSERASLHVQSHSGATCVRIELPREMVY